MLRILRTNKHERHGMSWMNFIKILSKEVALTMDGALKSRPYSAAAVERKFAQLTK